MEIGRDGTGAVRDGTEVGAWRPVQAPLPALTIGVCSWGAPLLLQHPRGNGVGPESLGGPMLGLDLLGFGSRIWVAGIQHGLQDAPPGIDEPARIRVPGQ